MTSKQIEEKIEKLLNRQGSAMPESIRLQVETTREHTLALYENALQASRTNEGILTLSEVLSVSLGAILSELRAFNKTLGEFGVGVVQVPPSGPVDEYPFTGGGRRESEEQTS